MRIALFVGPAEAVSEAAPDSSPPTARYGWPEVTVTRLVPEVGTDDMAEWHILIGIDRNLEPGTEIAVSLITRRDGAIPAD